MQSNPMRGVFFGVVIGSAMWLSGCAVYDAAIVGLHDSLDEMKNEKPVVVPTLPTTIPPIVKPQEPATTSNDIKPFSGRYSSGAKSTEYGEEIWIHNWNRLNIRIHANAGELKGEGIPTQGPWYPILASVIPTGTVTLMKTADGCALTARDFVSPAGQHYRFEGWRCDGLGPRMQKVYSVTLTASQMTGACFAWYATVEGVVK